MSIVIDFTMDKYICKQGLDGNASGRPLLLGDFGII